jgi:hypothetical protein
MVNVKDKRCAHEGCQTRASRGPLFSKFPIHCAKHATPFDFKKRNPRCAAEDCKERASHTEEGNYPTHCEDHAPSGAADVVQSDCGSCGLTSFIRAGTGLCNDCGDFIKIKATRARDEEIYRDFIIEAGFKPQSADRIPAGSCNRYRPDLLFDAGTHFVVVEIDEHQHSGYQCECEQARMINIAQDVGGGMPVRFIRFNPDAYRTSEGIRTKAKKGRTDILIKTLRSSMLHKPAALLTAIYLYYDGFDSHKLEVATIDMDIAKLAASFAAL